MCTKCGCEADETSLINLQTGAQTAISTIGERHGGRDRAASHSHPHEHQHRHNGNDSAPVHHHSSSKERHEHDDAYEHSHRHHARHAADSHVVDIEARILRKNDAFAAKNRAWLSGREILALNLVSSPGSGKTTLLERTIAELAGKLDLYVIEGDQATVNDGTRIRNAGAPVVQVNTGTGCHLDAEMVAHGLVELKPNPAAVVFIENVGNLVCPALFDLGEHAKVVIFSTTEGEDKPLKYPHMFRAASLAILNKIDLLPHLDFAANEAVENVHRVNPGSKVMTVSAKTGEGIAQWCDWVRGQAAAARQFSLVR